jgi:hypothetical protein
MLLHLPYSARIDGSAYLTRVGNPISSLAHDQTMYQPVVRLSLSHVLFRLDLECASYKFNEK